MASNTARISNVLLETLLEKYDNLPVLKLDLFKTALPAVTGSNIEAKYVLMTDQDLDESAQSSWRHTEKTIQQFLDADIYLLTVPMWNFGIPYVLKYYIDAIVQPGYLFRLDDQGRPEGLVKNKKMSCITSSESDYTSPPLQPLDFVESYLRTIFGFVGVTDIDFFKVQPMDISIETRKAAHKKAITQVRDYAEKDNWQL